MEQVSFVNGICTTKGGTHVDHVASLVASGVIEEMAKKIKLQTPTGEKHPFNIFVKGHPREPNLLESGQV